MKLFRGRTGFTLIELLVVILILAILMAIALPLYLRAVRDSQRQTCRSNMQTIANAEQAYRVRSVGHTYTENLTSTGLDALVGLDKDLQSLPRCPTDGDVLTADYSATINADGSITIRCAADGTSNDLEFHNTVGTDLVHGFTPGVDAE